MRSTYRALAGLIAIGVVLQAAFIALAWFTVINDVEGGAIFDENTEYNLGQSLHAIFGNVIPLLAVALLVVSFFAGIAGGVQRAAIVFGVAALQVVLALLSFDTPWVGALHGINALALAGVAGSAARLAVVTKAESGAPANAAP
jgi:hypothetical protein